MVAMRSDLDSAVDTTKSNDGRDARFNHLSVHLAYTHVKSLCYSRLNGMVCRLLEENGLTVESIP